MLSESSTHALPESPLFHQKSKLLCVALIRCVPSLLDSRFALQTSTSNDVNKHPLNHLTLCACGSVTGRSRFNDHVFSLNHKLFLKSLRSTLASQATMPKMPGASAPASPPPPSTPHSLESILLSAKRTRQKTRIPPVTFTHTWAILPSFTKDRYHSSFFFVNHSSQVTVRYHKDSTRRLPEILTACMIFGAASASNLASHLCGTAPPPSSCDQFQRRCRLCLCTISCTSILHAEPFNQSHLMCSLVFAFMSCFLRSPVIGPFPCLLFRTNRLLQFSCAIGHYPRFLP